MEELYYSKEGKRDVPLSQYKILRCHVKYTDKSRIDTVKPGTLIGFKDSKGNFIPLKPSKPTKAKQDEIEKDEELGL